MLLDLWLGDTSALDVLPAIERQPVYVPVVFMSAQADVTSSVLAMKHGAIDFLTKPVEPGPLLDAVIRAVARARAWREAAATRSEAAESLASLTRRELEVFDQVVLGKPNKRIAGELGTSEKTVKVHRGRVMHKLEAHSVVDLVRLADRARRELSRRFSLQAQAGCDQSTSSSRLLDIGTRRRSAPRPRRRRSGGASAGRRGRSPRRHGSRGCWRGTTRPARAPSDSPPPRAG